MNHLEIIVEEPSAESFLAAWLPRLLHERATFKLHSFQGKRDLLANIEGRLKGYRHKIDENTRIIVLLDRDNADCVKLKAKLEAAADAAGLSTRTTSGSHNWKVANRIVVEELEAWYFGAWSSVRRAYPKVPENVRKRSGLRHCDQVKGGTWETFERIMQSVGYFEGGLRKIEAAGKIGSVFEASLCDSPSFQAFHTALIEAIECDFVE